MIISDKTIRELNKEGFLVKNELKLKQIQPNSIDLSLASSFKKLLPNDFIELEGRKLPVIDLATPMKYEEGIINGPTYLLEPGEFILMASNEVLNIPNGIVGIVCGRSSIARVALQTEQAGFIDAGFTGTITFEMYNQSKYHIRIYLDMRIAQVYFITAEEASQLYGKGIGSKYNGQIVAQESLIHYDFKEDIID